MQYPNRTYFGGDFNLTFYNETYGSNATFHPADPTTPYWCARLRMHMSRHLHRQGKLSSTVQQLVDVWNVTGVYIDQLGAAGPVADWSNNKNHTKAACHRMHASDDMHAGRRRVLDDRHQRDGGAVQGAGAPRHTTRHRIQRRAVHGSAAGVCCRAHPPT